MTAASVAPDRSGSTVRMIGWVLIIGAFIAIVTVVPTQAVLASFGLLIVVSVLLRSQHDSAFLVLILLFVLAVVPASLGISGLGSLGAPTTVIGLAAGGIFFVSWVAPRWSVFNGEVALSGETEYSGRIRPIPVLIVVFLSANFASYAAAGMRAKDQVEGSAADRGIITMVAAAGIALLVSETVPTRQRLDAILRMIVLAGCFVATVGIAQFLVGFDLVAHIHIPLLSPISESLSVGERSIFRRVAGTTLHPIEFGVLVCMVIPVALHLAMHHSRRWYLAVAVLGLALPMSVSRTAVVGIGAMAIVLVPGWSRRVRHWVYAGAAAYLVAVRVLIPGLLGTLKALFVDAGVDPSITTRESDYEFVSRFFAERPIFGRGYATFIPTKFDFLDNQYLLSIVETGLVGAAAYLALIVGAMLAARSVRRWCKAEVDRDLAQALVASLAVVALTSAAFDFMSFPSVRVLLFVIVGCVGAIWRLVPHDRPPDSQRSGRADEAEGGDLPASRDFEKAVG